MTFGRWRRAWVATLAKRRWFGVLTHVARIDAELHAEIMPLPEIPMVCLYLERGSRIDFLWQSDE
jgi:hypothetical protein